MSIYIYIYLCILYMYINDIAVGCGRFRGGGNHCIVRPTPADRSYFHLYTRACATLRQRCSRFTKSAAILLGFGSSIRHSRARPPRTLSVDVAFPPVFCVFYNIVFSIINKLGLSHVLSNSVASMHLRYNRQRSLRLSAAVRYHLRFNNNDRFSLDPSSPTPRVSSVCSSRDNRVQFENTFH